MRIIIYQILSYEKHGFSAFALDVTSITSLPDFSHLIFDVLILADMVDRFLSVSMGLWRVEMDTSHYISAP